MQLFILPYAGGSIGAFKKLTSLIDDRIDVVTVEYSGRGTRAKENFATDIWELLNDAVQYCSQRRIPSIPYAVMGYSMGSILGYEMISKKPLPGRLVHFFVSAEISPLYRSLELQKFNNPTDAFLLSHAEKLGGLNSRMLQNDRFSEIYIQPMLSDYRLFYGYRFNNSNKKIKVDTTFFYCEKDTPYEDIRKWNELIEGNYDYYEFGDNHFFINQYFSDMAEVINNTLCKTFEVSGNEF